MTSARIVLAAKTRLVVTRFGLLLTIISTGFVIYKALPFANKRMGKNYSQVPCNISPVWRVPHLLAHDNGPFQFPHVVAELAEKVHAYAGYRFVPYP